jgi:hypothetical protein
MRKWNIFGLCAAITVYVILMNLFYTLNKDLFSGEDLIFHNCGYHNACVSFCEDSDFEKFTDDIIKKNFPFEDFKTYYRGLKTYDELATNRFRIVKHKIKCQTFDKRVIVNNLRALEFFSVGINHTQFLINM